MHERAWIEIDAAALTHNATVLRRAVPASARLGILVKANGYGHGMELAAGAALAGGADMLLVATLDEALALRATVVRAPILVVYPIDPAGAMEAVAARIETSVGGVEGVEEVLGRWSEAVRDGAPGRLRLHVEVDSGMGRGGIPPAALVEMAARIGATPDVDLVGVWSHLADGSDPGRSRAQVERFEAALATLAAAGRPFPMRHMAASEGLFVETAPTYDLARVGLAYYGTLGLGVHASPRLADLAAELRPAMTVTARPVRLETIEAGTPVGYGSEWSAARRSVIATLPIGYADGWTRAYWPGASALVRGRRVPLVGRVSMDSVCADVTDVDGLSGDDPFVLLGAQGDERITADDLAALRGSIPNEVFCAFGPRLPRIAVGTPGEP
jgi:alanine racemase